jgi:hypothetical protein
MTLNARVLLSAVHLLLMLLVGFRTTPTTAAESSRLCSSGRDILVCRNGRLAAVPGDDVGKHV